ncbi:MAG: DUF427 domain-containing protein [Candidatus Sericytochromatia bacterium]|nr:DUF427 domain-containing protein [Candidatus Sericytochromatia bacterium]
MPQAIWEGVVLAEADASRCERVEGNVYFPPDSLVKGYFEESEHQTVCGWKGTASYHHVVVNDKRNENAAWFYPEPKDAARAIRGFVAFWKGVRVIE